MAEGTRSDGSPWPNARKVGIIDVPLQGISPGKSPQTTSDHKLTREHVRSGLNTLLVRQAFLDALAVQVGFTHADSTAYPLFRLPPTDVGCDVTLQVWNTLVPLDVIASDEGTLEVGSLVDEQGRVFALEVTRWNIMPIRVGTSCCITRRIANLPWFRGGEASGREDHGTERLEGRLALLLLLIGGGLGWMVLVVVVGRRSVVAIAVRLGAIEAVRRNGWASRGG